MCDGLSGGAPDCRPFTGKCGNAVLSFPVCNYLKSLAGIRSHNRRPVLRRAAAEGFGLPERPLARPRMCGIYFLSGNMTSAGRELGVCSINNAAFLGRSRASL